MTACGVELLGESEGLGLLRVGWKFASWEMEVKDRV